MHTVRLSRTGRRPLEVTAELIWEFKSSPERASIYYSGSMGRWWVLSLYRTPEKLLLHEQRYSNWEGEQDTAAVLEFVDLEAVQDWLEEHYPQAAPDFAQEFDIKEAR